MVQSPWEVLGVSASASPSEIKRAFRKIAMSSHPDALHAALADATPEYRHFVLKRGSNRFRIAAKAYKMYDMENLRWQTGPVASTVNVSSRNQSRGWPHGWACGTPRYEEPPFDLRRFAALRLHPKTRVMIFGVNMAVTIGLAVESYLRASHEDILQQQRVAPLQL